MSDSKTVILFLHGAGGTKSSFAEFVADAAKFYDAEVVAFDAPIPFNDGFTYMRKDVIDGERVARESDYRDSMEFLKNKILGLGVAVENIILIGHSQGGQMAICLGMLFPFKKAISIVGDFPRAFTYELADDFCRDCVLIEGGNDTYITDSRKKSFEVLPYKFPHFVAENVEHFAFNFSDIEKFL